MNYIYIKFVHINSIKEYMYIMCEYICIINALYIYKNIIKKMHKLHIIRMHIYKKN